MKKVMFIVTLLGCMAILFLGTNFRSAPESEENITLKKHCVGYTIIEAGKGVDCNGDTIRLVKTHGFYEAANRN